MVVSVFDTAISTLLVSENGRLLLDELSAGDQERMGGFGFGTKIEST
jgi:hypothetical protein